MGLGTRTGSSLLVIDVAVFGDEEVAGVTFVEPPSVVLSGGQLSACDFVLADYATRRRTRRLPSRDCRSLGLAEAFAISLDDEVGCFDRRDVLPDPQ